MQLLHNLIHMNCLDNVAGSIISKFADDTIIGKLVKSDLDGIDLKADLDWMNKWTNS